MTVRVDAEEPPDSVTLAGFKDAVGPATGIETPRETLPANPFSLVRVICEERAEPA